MYRHNEKYGEGVILSNLTFTSNQRITSLKRSLTKVRMLKVWFNYLYVNYMWQNKKFNLFSKPILALPNP